MTFEILTKNDLDETRHLQPDDWSDIIPSLSYYVKSEFCYPVKVLLGDRIVGIGARIVLEFSSWLAHIIVSPEHRNQGIGYSIVEHLLENPSNASSRSFLLIATKSGEPLYRKAGFRTVTEYVFLKRVEAWSHQSILKNIVPFSEKHRSRIFELDEEITGEVRQKILEEYLSESLLYLDGDAVSGYFIPGLGDGLIIADTVDAGIELMKLKYATVEKAVLPVENKAGITFLLENGFAESSRALRMLSGEDILWKPANIFSRIGGNFG